MKSISLQVKDDTARLVERMPANKKAELSQMIDVLVSKPDTILQVMEEMGEYAAKQGLTPEILDKLLKEK